jgi:hypothetical protein
LTKAKSDENDDDEWHKFAGFRVLVIGGGGTAKARGLPSLIFPSILAAEFYCAICGKFCKCGNCRLHFAQIPHIRPIQRAHHQYATD